MSRDPSKLKVFQLADELVAELHRCTRSSPAEERCGLQARIRRAAESVPTNIVEGCARREGLPALALGSAFEVPYLLRLAPNVGDK